MLQRGGELGSVVSEGNGTPQSMWSRKPGQLHAHVYIFYKYITIAISKCYTITNSFAKYL